MFLTLVLFALLGSGFGALCGAAIVGVDGLLLGGSAGFVAGVAAWILLWIGYQRFAPAMLTAEDEYRQPSQPAREFVRR